MKSVKSLEILEDLSTNFVWTSRVSVSKTKSSGPILNSETLSKSQQRLQRLSWW